MNKIISFAFIMIFPGCALAASFSSVPTASLSSGESSQDSQVGSFCWPLNGENMCVDKRSLSTPSSPLMVRAPIKLNLYMPLPTQIKHIEYMLKLVKESDLNARHDRQGVKFWNIPVENVKTIKPVGSQAIEFNLPPGLYVLVVFGWWSGVGDSTHGFLVEVKP